MERSAIRSVAFGGFDKEDVARYIEQLSQETEKLREERDALQEKADCLEKEADELRTQVQELTKAREELSAEMARLAPLEKENAQLKEQVEALRPDAEAHVMLRGQVGAIECEARQRAAELEEHTAGHPLDGYLCAGHRKAGRCTVCADVRAGHRRGKVFSELKSGPAVEFSTWQGRFG